MDILSILNQSLNAATDEEAEERISKLVVTDHNLSPDIAAGGLIIRRRSMLTDIERERFIPNLTVDMLRRWMQGELAQRAMQGVSAEDREYVMTGIINSEFHAMEDGI
tara:strand:- start:1139 stop:1462 length:324 start_codon:yes stop_codon:yes gene_type:complete